jgi:hypothetical protein
MKKLSLLLLLIPSALAAQRDTTLCTAFRVRTSVNGSILSMSTTKVACGAATRVDTVKVPGPVVHDTVAPSPAPQPLDPRGYNCWQARDAANPSCVGDDKAVALSQTLVLHRYGQTFGFAQWMWKGVITAYDPSLPLAGIDTVYLPGKRDTIIVVRVDTVRVPGPTPTPPGAPELPRGMAAMDSMVRSSRAADVNTASWPHIHQDSTGKWVCFLNCTPAALARAKAMNAAPKTTPKKPTPKKQGKEPVG